MVAEIKRQEPDPFRCAIPALEQIYADLFPETQIPYPVIFARFVGAIGLALGFGHRLIAGFAVVSAFTVLTVLGCFEGNDETPVVEDEKKE